MPSSEELASVVSDNSFAGEDQERHLRGFCGIWAVMAHTQRKPINIRAAGAPSVASRTTWAHGICNRLSWQYPSDFVVVCTTIENVHLSCSSIVHMFEGREKERMEEKIRELQVRSKWVIE